MPIRKIYEQVLDEDGNLTFDENGVAITRCIGEEEYEEDVVPNIPTIYSLGELEQDPNPMVLNTSWILVEGEKRTWKKYTKEGLVSEPC